MSIQIIGVTKKSIYCNLTYSIIKFAVLQFSNVAHFVVIKQAKTENHIFQIMKPIGKPGCPYDENDC